MEHSKIRNNQNLSICDWSGLSKWWSVVELFSYHGLFLPLSFSFSRFLPQWLFSPFFLVAFLSLLSLFLSVFISQHPSLSLSVSASLFPGPPCYHSHICLLSVALVHERGLHLHKQVWSNLQCSSDFSQWSSPICLQVGNWEKGRSIPVWWGTFYFHSLLMLVGALYLATIQ